MTHNIQISQPTANGYQSKHSKKLQKLESQPLKKKPSVRKDVVSTFIRKCLVVAYTLAPNTTTFELDEVAHSFCFSRKNTANNNMEASTTNGHAADSELPLFPEEEW